MAITFSVDDVAPATVALPTTRLADGVAPDTLVFGGDPHARVIDTHGAHPLLGAVHAAFADHRPLVLSPDAVWLTLAQGVAQHVRLHAEELRPRLVRHAGRKGLAVSIDSPLPTTPEGWTPIIDAFRAQIAEHTGQGLARLFTCDFSTSSVVDRVASEIVLMDAVSPYFDFFLACVCGIPTITLLGTADDWRRIRARIDVIAELDLALWARSLAPIADEFVRAAEGNPDPAFWKRIYKPRSAYGWDKITGWVARLFPYLERDGRIGTPNPLLELPLDEPSGGPDGEKVWYDGPPGVRLGEVPASPSSVFLRVTDAEGGTRSELLIEGGLMAVEQDAAGALRPISGYRIRTRTTGMLDVVDRILAVGRVAADLPSRMPPSGTAEQLAFQERVGSVHLFAGESEWWVRGARERMEVDLTLPGGHRVGVARWIDLSGDRYIGCVTLRGGETLYVLGDAALLEERFAADHAIHFTPRQCRTRQSPETFPVVGTSLATLLAYGLDHDGALPPATGDTLLQRLPPWMLEPLPVRPASR